jgi:hypothetical protein
VRDVFRIGAGVAVGIGLLVAAGAGRDTPAPRAPVLDDADDVEAPVPLAIPAVAVLTPPSPPPAPPAPGLPPARARWQAGARPPGPVVPSLVVRAARRQAEPLTCTPPAADGAPASACPVTPAHPAVEIQWNAPGSTP